MTVNEEQDQLVGLAETMVHFAGGAAEVGRSELRHAPAIIAVHKGVEHRFLLANASYVATVARADLIGQPLRAVLPELRNQGAIDAYDEVLRSGRPRFLQNVEFADGPEMVGGPRRFSFVLEPFKNHEEEVLGVLCHGYECGTDVRTCGDVEVMLDDLRRQQASLDLAFAIGGMNHFTLDVASGLIAGGPLVRRLLGEPDIGDAFSVDRLLGKLDEATGRQLAKILADLPRHDIAVDIELVAVDHAAIDAIRLVGQTRTRPTPILAGIMVDETKRRRSEVLLRRRAADLAAANRQLEQFTHIVSHDLKSPLRGVHHLASFLREDLAEAASPQVLEHLDKLDRQVTKMSRMLDDLQAYVHLDRRAGKIETVDLEALGVELGELVSLPDGFALDVDVEPVRIETDRTALSLVLRNLLDNSLKHHDRRSGRLCIEARPLCKGRQLFKVTDDGPGIVRRYRKRVFELFHCLGGAGPGSGMGLAFVKRAVERQGGRVWIEDGPGGSTGRGVTFCFTWPLVGRGKLDG